MRTNQSLLLPMLYFILQCYDVLLNHEMIVSVKMLMATNVTKPFQLSLSLLIVKNVTYNNRL